VIVLVVHIGGVPFKKPESDTPVPTDSHCPLPSTISSKRVQNQPGEVHIIRADRDIKATKYEPQPLGMLRLNPGFRAFEKEPLDALMPEGANHASL